MLDWNDLVEALLRDFADVSIETRISMIEDLNNSHYKYTGENLSSPLLLKLANWLLKEVLQSTDQGKRDMEYPFHSSTQEKRRSAREKCIEYRYDDHKTSYNMDFLNSKYKERLSSLCKRKY